MSLRVALGCNPTRSAVAALVLAALGATCAILVRPDRDPNRLLRSARSELRAGRFDRAESTMRRLLALRPATEDDWFTMAQLAMATGRTNEALDDLAHVPDSHALAAQARLWEGQLELRRQRAAAAESSLRRAIEIDASLVAARRELVYLYGVQRRCHEPSAEFATLAEVAPMSFDQVSLWCLIGIAPWDPREVQPILAAFVQADPFDRASRLALAEAYGSLGQYEDVEAVLKHLPVTDPGARAILARIAVDRGDAPTVESLVANGPDDHPILQLYRGQLALLRRDLPAAVGHFRKWTAADPHDRARLHMLGDALVKSGKLVEGELYLQAARDHEVLYKLIDRASTAEGRQNLSLLKDLGAAYQRVGLIPEAKAWYKLALARDPADPGVQVALYHLGAAAARARINSTTEPGPSRDGGMPAVTSECRDAMRSKGRDLAPRNSQTHDDAG
jgi:tetratricopeptide (TPR) repeat protein